MSTVTGFEVISNKFNTDKICTQVVSSSQKEKMMMTAVAITMRALCNSFYCDFLGFRT